MTAYRINPTTPQGEPPTGFTFQLSRVVPLGVVLSLLLGMFSAGVALQKRDAASDQQNDRLKWMADTTAEHFARLEASTGARFEAIDRRRDSTVAGINERLAAADKRDGDLAEATARLDLRLTRIEALREFNAANGSGKK